MIFDLIHFLYGEFLLLSINQFIIFSKIGEKIKKDFKKILTLWKQVSYNQTQ